MKRIAAIIAIPFIALSLSACGSSAPAEEPAEEEVVVEEDPQSEEELVVEEEVEEEEAPAAASNVVPFGETYEWPTGVAISISPPVDFTTTEWASGTIEGQANVAVDVTITNGSGEDVDAAMVFLTATSGGKQASEVFDTDGGTEYPIVTVLPGDSLTWTTAFSVADPASLTVTAEVMWEFDADKVHFRTE